MRAGLVGMLTLGGACAENQPDRPDVPSTTTSVPPTSAPITVGSVDPDRLPVFVVVEDIPARTTAEAAVEQGLLEESSRPFTEFPEDAVVTLDLLAGTVAAADLPAGEVLVAGMFVDPDARGPEPEPATAPTTTGTGPPTTAEPDPPTTGEDRPAAVSLGS